MKLLEDKISDYVIENSTPVDEILEELDRITHILTTRPRMMSGAVQGSIMRMITRMVNPDRVLEIGTFTGYSAICIASAMRSGTSLHTVDINDETAYIAKDFFVKSGYDSIINQHIGSAVEVIPEIGGVFDLIFMDGNKREYSEYYDLLMNGGYVGSGTVILADNVLWDGKVVDETATDKQTKSILEFNRMVNNDSRVEVIILPLRDGMSIIRVK